MRICPYCTIPFSTKQRLVSHLTKSKKCYNIQSIGMPPILLELMGYVNNPSGTSIKPQSSKKITTSVNQLDKNELIDSKEEPPKQTNWKCDYCRKYFINEKNLERHLSNQKCPKNKKQKIESQTDIINDGQTSSIKKVIDMVADVDESESMDEDDQNKVERNMFDVYLPKHKKDLLPSRSKKTGKMGTSINLSNELNTGQNVRYIVKEDYTKCLIELTGSEVEAHKLLKSSIASKERGAIDLLYKIYCEGRTKSNYPIDIIDLKTKALRYKTPTDNVLDEQYSYIKSVLIDNLIGTYLKHSNYVIAKISNSLSSGNNDDDTQDHGDVGSVQTHIMSLSTDKMKDKIILGLLALLNKKK